MKSRHFAVVAQLGNGHVYPTLPLCAELSKRGHRVTYITNRHYAPMIVEVGAEPVLISSKRMPNRLVDDLKMSLALPMDDPRVADMMKSWQSHCADDSIALVSQVDSFYSENSPDMIVYDRYHIAGRILANRHQVPAVQISSHFAYYNDLPFRINGVCQKPDAAAEWSRNDDSFLSSCGIESSGSYWHVENLNVHLLPKEFQFNADSFDERFCFAGALLDRPFYPVWKDRSGGRPLILISGISLFSDTKVDYSGYFGMLVEALSELPYHCVLSIGDAEFSRILPSNFELNRSASHLEILPHADLSICHGGMTSTLEAIYHGVPPLMIPMAPACEEVAYRAEELGIGVHLSRAALSIENLRDTVSAMLQDCSLQERVKYASGVFRLSGGAELAANRIEGCLGSSSA